MENILFLEKGNMNECWKILVLLLKAAYLGSVMDDDDDQEGAEEEEADDEGEDHLPQAIMDGENDHENGNNDGVYSNSDCLVSS